MDNIDTIVTNFRDVTLSKQIENQKALFASIINSSDNVILSKNLLGIITTWNRGAEKLFGYSDGEILGKHISILIPQDRLDEELEIMEKIKQGKVVESYETERIKKNGNHICILLTVSPIKDIKGNVMGASQIAHDITQRKNSEIALRESEAQIQAIINASPDAVIIIDEAGKIIKWDAKSETLFGWKEAEVLGRTLSDTILPHRYREAHSKGMKHFLETGKGPIINKTIEISGLNKNEIEFDISLRISPAVIKNNYQFIGFIRDITSRKREETQLQLSEERYRQIVETAHEGIWTIDENNKTNFVNEKMCEILEYTSDEMMGKELYYFMDKEGKALTTHFFENQKNEIKENFEFKYITKSGKQIWGSVATNPIFGEGHQYKGALAMITDITERKQAEETLRRSEANLRTIFDSTTSSYILLDTELKILSFNPIAALWAKNSLEVDLKEGDAWPLYFHSNQKKDIKERAKKVLMGDTMKYEVSYLQLNSSSLNSYEVLLSPVFQHKQKVMGLCITLSDITERKQLERETLHLVVSLQKRNNELKQFTYVLSHNLRSPIAKILGLASLFETDPEKESINPTLLSNITEAATNLDRVVKDLNTVISLRESGNAIHEYILLKPELDRIKKVLESEISECKAAIRSYFLHPKGINTISSYLYSIIYNLLSNAIKYRSPERPLKIYLKTTQDRQFICLSLEDNGMGIDLKKYRDKIFGLYKRFHGETIPGKGIGLNLVKAQVESLGGKVEIESEVNKGTTFKVFFPKNQHGNGTN